MYNALFKESNDPLLDTLTTEALELIMSQFCLVVIRQLSDHLPGGTLSKVTDKLKKMKQDLLLKQTSLESRCLAL